MGDIKGFILNWLGAVSFEQHTQDIRYIEKQLEQNNKDIFILKTELAKSKHEQQETNELVELLRDKLINSSRTNEVSLPVIKKTGGWANRRRKLENEHLEMANKLASEVATSSLNGYEDLK